MRNSASKSPAAAKSFSCSDTSMGSYTVGCFGTTGIGTGSFGCFGTTGTGTGSFGSGLEGSVSFGGSLGSTFVTGAFDCQLEIVDINTHTNPTNKTKIPVATATQRQGKGALGSVTTGTTGSGGCEGGGSGTIGGGSGSTGGTVSVAFLSRRRSSTKSILPGSSILTRKRDFGFCSSIPVAICYLI